MRMQVCALRGVFVVNAAVHVKRTPRGDTQTTTTRGLAIDLILVHSARQVTGGGGLMHRPTLTQARSRTNTAYTCTRLNTPPCFKDPCVCAAAPALAACVYAWPANRMRNVGAGSLLAMSCPSSIQTAQLRSQHRHEGNGRNATHVQYEWQQSRLR